MVRISKKARVETASTPQQQQVLWDEFLADEIFSRLPARSAAGCAGLSRGIRRLLTSPEFWLRRSMLMRLRLVATAPQSPPFSQLFQHAACLTKLVFWSGKNTKSTHCNYTCSTHFHAVGRAPAVFSIKHRVGTGGPYAPYKFAGTCNGLVLLVADRYLSWLLASKRRRRPVDAVVVNPATREEEAVRISLPPPPPGWDRSSVYLCGFGYSPSTRAYRALIVERQCRGGRTASRLMVASFGCSQAPRTVLSCEFLHYGGCLSTDDDGMVYLLANPNSQPGKPLRCSVVLALSVDDEAAAVTAIPLPPGRLATSSGLMKIWSRPCVAVHDDAKNVVVLWTLAAAAAAAAAATENRCWERRCALMYNKVPGNDDRICQIALRGALVHGNHLLALFEHGDAHLYNLRERPRKREGGGAHRPSWTSDQLDHVPMHPHRGQVDFLWGYHPTLISPATIFGGEEASVGGPGAACLTRMFRLRRRRESDDAAWNNYLDVVVGMLPNLHARRQVIKIDRAG